MLTQAIATIGVLFMLLTGCAPSLLTYTDDVECRTPLGEEKAVWGLYRPGVPFPGPYTREWHVLERTLIKNCFAQYDMAAYRAERWGEGGGGGAGIPFVFVAPSAGYPYRPGGLGTLPIVDRGAS